MAFGHGALWVTDRARGRVLRVDAESGTITGEVAVAGIPRDVAVSSDGVWVTVGARSAAAAACETTVDGGRPVDGVVVVDLPLQRGSRSPTAAMARAVGYVVERHGYSAGRFRIGYRICDDSTAQTGSWDPAKCTANARAYAADPRVLIEVGPYNSGCAERQIPVAADAPSGPLAMVSPTNTAPGLTRDVRAGARTAYARIIATDDRQGETMVAELRRRGDRSVFVLDDAAGSSTLGLELSSYFTAAARSGGLRVVGRASWNRVRDVSALAARIVRARTNAVYMSGDLDSRAGRIVRALRRASPRMTLAGPDLLLPVASLFDAAGSAAKGMLITTTVLPVEAMGEDGRALAAQLARDQGAAAVHPAAVYAAVSTEIALDAIARSDGSRRSVARALLATRLTKTAIGPIAFDAHGDLRAPSVAVVRARHGRGSDDLLSTEGADLIAVD